MSEPTTTILLDEGSASSSLNAGLGTDDKGSSQDTPAEDVDTLRTENARLKEQNAQYLRERKGWESQSLRNKQERDMLAERLARVEGRLEAAPQDTQLAAQMLESEDITDAELDEAFQGWFEGDKGVKMKRILTKIKGKPQQAQSVSSADIQKMIRSEIVELGQRSSLQSVVGRRHPEMQNPQSELSQAVWEAYDTFEQDPDFRLMYPKNQATEVAMIGPDGSTRPVDARLVDRICIELKARAGVLQGRRDEARDATVGRVQGGNGASVQPKKQLAVEAIDLLTPGEIDLITSRDVQRGWPEMPKERKAAAKYFYDTLTPTDKAKRLDDYRRRQAGAA